MSDYKAEPLPLLSVNPVIEAVIAKDRAERAKRMVPNQRSVLGNPLLFAPSTTAPSATVPSATVPSTAAPSATATSTTPAPLTTPSTPSNNEVIKKILDAERKKKARAMLIPPSAAAPSATTQPFVGGYKQKYLKYKEKYLFLKNYQ